MSWLSMYINPHLEVKVKYLEIVTYSHLKVVQLEHILHCITSKYIFIMQTFQNQIYLRTTLGALCAIHHIVN